MSSSTNAICGKCPCSWSTTRAGRAWAPSGSILPKGGAHIGEDAGLDPPGKPGQQVGPDVCPAPLSSSADGHCGDGFLQALVGTGAHPSHATLSPGGEVTQESHSEGAVLAGARLLSRQLPLALDAHGTGHDRAFRVRRPSTGRGRSARPETGHDGHFPKPVCGTPSRWSGPGRAARRMGRGPPLHRLPQRCGPGSPTGAWNPASRRLTEKGDALSHLLTGHYPSMRAEISSSACVLSSGWRKWAPVSAPASRAV